MRLVNTQKSHFVRRQPNAAVPKAPLHNGPSDAEEFRQLGVLLGAPCMRVVLYLL